MNTKGANLLLSTLLVATCVAAPAFAADDTVKADDKAKADNAKALPAGAPDASLEPKAPAGADAKDIGKKNRGIIIKNLAPAAKPIGKATTAENKGTKPGNVKAVMNEGSHTFGKGLFDQSQPLPSKPTAVAHPRAIKTQPIPAKALATPAVIQKSTNVPLQVKTASVKTQPAKSVPAKTTEVVATKHTTSNTKTVVINAGEQIVSAWLNKRGDKPHFKDGERLQVNVAANKDCNLMIFNYDGEQLTQLYPNEFQTNPFVKAGQTIEVGGEGCKFDFTAANPSSSKPSNEKIFVYAYPLESDSAPISIAMARVPDSPFRAAEMTPEKYRELVNKSEVFFSRKVNVTGRKSKDTEEVQLASFEQQTPTSAPNKIELHLVIDPNKK